VSSLTDQQLLRDYAGDRSEAAFAELVRRHVDFVYSAALRMVRDAHLAEDVTQGVFVALAQNARQLADRPVLSGWLHRTTQNLAAKIVGSDVRRRAREQEAVAMNEVQEPDTAWEYIEPHLDGALNELSDADRDALLLRYFQRQSAREMAQTLGMSEDAAQKRVSRAVERMRELFAKNGVTVGANGLVLVLAANAVQAAPVGLCAAITASSSVAKATVITMNWLNAKLVAGIIVLAAIAGAGTFLIQQSRTAQAQSARATAAPSAPAAALPLKFANDAFGGKSDDRFLVGIDPLTKRTNGSTAAGHIKSLVEPAGLDSPDYLRLRAARLVRLSVTKDSPLFGKRIRLTGWLKTKDVDNWAGPGLMIFNPDGKIIAMDEMMDRPIRGTTDWQQYEMVADLPAENCSIDFRVMLYGTGELWSDDFQIDVVSTNTPITDDRRWHKWSPNAADYSVAPDPDNSRDGHPTLCLAYTPHGPAPRGSWMWWGQCIREPEKYAGHTVRMTVWIKCEGASGNVGINLRPKGPNFQLIAEDDRSLRRPLRGTMDWTERSIFCAIPKETQCFDTGFYFNGKGKVWIDMESLKYEIIDEADSVPVK
jgi:RNA polymerase sigma factor (sigma-70 family)